MEDEVEQLKDKKKEIDEQSKDKKKEIDEQIKKLKLKNMKENTKRNSVNKLIRVSREFDNEIVEIINQRSKLKKDKSKISKPAVTNLIIKHKFWRRIKLDLLNFVFERKPKNKRGQMTIFVLVAILGIFLSAIFLLVGGIVTVKMNEILSQNITMGQVNLGEINANTFGVAATTYLNNADWWGVAVIFGMIMGLFLSSYFLRNKFSKLGIILDIFIMIATFIFATYISSTYRTLLNVMASIGEDYLEVYAPKMSMFILNLPIFSVIIGVIIMILFHSSIPSRAEERAQPGGSLQGL